MPVYGIFNHHGGFLKTFAIILFFAVCLFFFSIGNYYNSDEGVILNGAWRMYNGDQLYTDFFSYIAPGSYWWTELSFRIFGPTYFSARIFSILLLAVSIIAVYQIVIISGGTKFAGAIAALLWLLGNILNGAIINHNNHSSYLALTALLLVAAAVTLKKSSYFFIAGFLLGLTTLFLQTKGLAVAAGLGLLFLVYVVLGKITKKDPVLFGVGFIAVTLPVFFIWDPAFLYETLIIWPAGHYPAANKISYGLWLAAASVFLIVTTLVFRIKKLLNTDAIAVLATSQLFMLISSLNRPDFSHIFLASPILIIFGALAFDKYLPVFAELFNLHQNIFKNLTLGFSALAVFVTALAAGAGATRSEIVFKDLIKSKTINSLYAHPFLPGMYFELGLANPYYYDTLLSGMFPEEAYLENLQKVKAENPDYVFVDYGLVGKFKYNTSNPLDALIAENYETANAYGSFKILKRK